MAYSSKRLGKMSWLPYALLLLAAALVLGIGYWTWQAYEFSRAFRALKAEQYAEVIPRTERLLAFGPDKLRAQVIQVRALIELDLEGSREELEALMANGGARQHPEVGLAFLQLRMESKDLNGIDEYIDQWSGSLSSNSEFLLILAKIRVQQERLDEAYASLTQLLTLDPKNAEARLMRGQLLLLRGDRPSAVMAKVDLRTAGNQRGNIGRKAVLAMATSPLIPLFDNDREWILIRLRDSRNSDSYSRLVAALQQMILEPNNRAAIIAETIRKEGTENPRLMVEWLMANGAYEQLFAFLQSPASSKLAAEDRWVTEVRAALLSKDNEQAQRLLNESDQPISELRRASLLAYASASAGNQSEPTVEWQAAFDMALKSKSAMELFSLGKLALENQWLTAAEQSFQAAMDANADPKLEFTIIPYYVVLLSGEGRTKDTLALIRRSLELRPDDVSMLNNQYYLEGLLDDPGSADPHRIAPLVRAVPNSVMHSTYSFLLWKAGLQAEAKRQFELLDPKFLVIPSCRLGGALVAIDDEDYATARKLLDGVDESVFLPEEAVLYRKAIAELQRQ